MKESGAERPDQPHTATTTNNLNRVNSDTMLNSVSWRKPSPVDGHSQLSSSHKKSTTATAEIVLATCDQRHTTETDLTTVNVQLASGEDDVSDESVMDSLLDKKCKHSENLPWRNSKDCGVRADAGEGNKNGSTYL